MIFFNILYEVDKASKESKESNFFGMSERLTPKDFRSIILHYVDDISGDVVEISKSVLRSKVGKNSQNEQALSEVRRVAQALFEPRNIVVESVQAMEPSYSWKFNVEFVKEKPPNTRTVKVEMLDGTTTCLKIRTEDLKQNRGRSKCLNAVLKAAQCYFGREVGQVEKIGAPYESRYMVYFALTYTITNYLGNKITFSCEYDVKMGECAFLAFASHDGKMNSKTKKRWMRQYKDIEVAFTSDGEVEITRLRRSGNYRRCLHIEDNESWGCQTVCIQRGELLLEDGRCGRHSASRPYTEYCCMGVGYCGDAKGCWCGMNNPNFPQIPKELFDRIEHLVVED